MLIKSGICFENIAVFTDRGNLLAASSLIFAKLGLILNLKFCFKHIIRNVISMFHIPNDDTQPLRNIMNFIQCAVVDVVFFEYMLKLTESYGHEVSLYVLKIHPTHYSVYGNLLVFDMATHLKHLQRFAFINYNKEQCGQVDQNWFKSSVPVGKPL